MSIVNTLSNNLTQALHSLSALDSLDKTVHAIRPPVYGQVEDVTGLIVQSRGPEARIGDICNILDPETQHRLVQAEVVGFRDGKLQLMALGTMTQLAIGCWVENTQSAFTAPIGEALCGRIIDAFGNPLDGLGPILAEGKRLVEADAPDAMTRDRISETMTMGVKAWDAFLTTGYGQRLGIFAGSGVGKSTLQGMIARGASADINVIALIGERGREVREFVEESLGSEGLARSVVVVATSEQPPVTKIKAAMVATTIAEAFRDQGKNVLFMLDSVTRVAMALREVGLSVGEPPTSRGYTPSVFTFLPKLLERAGTSDTGSITGLYTVLVEGDDMNEPIADAVRGILDGHVVLSRELAEQNHFPAIDVLASISRLMLYLTTPEQREAASRIRDWLAVYRQNEDILSIGAYAKGSNPKLDLAIDKREAILSFLKQDVLHISSIETTMDALFHLAK